MNKKEEKYYKRAIKFLEYFGTDLSRDILYLTDGGNSVIMNPKTEWQEFLGYSINSIVKYVAKIQNKKTEWLN